MRKCKAPGRSSGSIRRNDSSTVGYSGAARQPEDSCLPSHRFARANPMGSQRRRQRVDGRRHLGRESDCRWTTPVRLDRHLHRPARALDHRGAAAQSGGRSSAIGRYAARGLHGGKRRLPPRRSNCAGSVDVFRREPASRCRAQRRVAHPATNRGEISGSRPVAGQRAASGGRGSLCGSGCELHDQPAGRSDVRFSLGDGDLQRHANARHRSGHGPACDRSAHRSRRKSTTTSGSPGRTTSFTPTECRFSIGPTIRPIWKKARFSRKSRSRPTASSARRC